MPDSSWAILIFHFASCDIIHYLFVSASFHFCDHFMETDTAHRTHTLTHSSFIVHRCTMVQWYIVHIQFSHSNGGWWITTNGVMRPILAPIYVSERVYNACVHWWFDPSFANIQKSINRLVRMESHTGRAYGKWTTRLLSRLLEPTRRQCFEI